jgi:uncharacterized membrane-anchored protein
MRKLERRNCRGLISLLVLTLLPGAVVAQNPDSVNDSLANSIDWTHGPRTVPVGSVAKMSVPAQCVFTGATGAQAFMRLTRNPPTGAEEGVLLCPIGSDIDDDWFVVVSYDPSGYVRDGEGASLDADAILASLRHATAQGNIERRKNGWDTLSVKGWIRAPYYDLHTHNLTWSTKVLSGGTAAVNHSVRLLGREGVMHIDLVASPEQLASVLPTFDSVIAETRFTPGHTYAEWRQGDKVASYGLTALIAGGAGAAAVKMGLFAKLWKLLAAAFLAVWKVLVAAVLGVVAWFRRVLGRRDKRRIVVGSDGSP